MAVVPIWKEESVFLDFKASSQKQLFQRFAKEVASFCAVGEEGIFEALWARERLTSTAVGEGAAIPHAKLPLLPNIFIFFVRTAAPLEFGADDGQPVDLLFFILAPENAQTEHLRVLTSVARILGDKNRATLLRKLQDKTEIYTLLEGLFHA